MTLPDDMTRAGFIAFLGAPNAGKSTLINHVVGTKVSIVSPKVQTTRTRVLGIMMHQTAQLIFVDTPGIFAPKRRLERAMVSAAWNGAADADVICVLLDAKRGLDDDSRAICRKLQESGKKAILILTKIDLVPQREKLLVLTDSLNQELKGLFTDIFMISAETDSGTADLVAHLAQKVPAGPWLFPEDEISDMPQRMLAAEITREKIFLKLHEELPYSITVETERWEEQADGSARIEQVIYVLRDSQKAIVLGKGGQQIKAIGAAARQELEDILERRVHLFLYVKVREGWIEDRSRYREMGLEFDS